MDDFTSFSWRGQDAWEEYGAFIINESNGLKFYNGSNFTNDYSQPQFDASAGQLLGVNFSIQTISFKIGVYWISAAEYRRFQNYLHPLVTDVLMFGFDTHYRYNVKLAKREDSIRYVIGKEGNEPMYYTEMTLSFEVQGESCAIGTIPYSWKTPNNECVYSIRADHSDNIDSDLATPIVAKFTTTFYSTNENNKDNKFRMIFTSEYANEKIELFTLVLKNITVDADLPLNIEYNSRQGLLFLSFGDSQEKILNLQNLTDTGEKIVDSFSCNKFLMPGIFDYADFNKTELKLKLTFEEMLDNEWQTIAVASKMRSDKNEELNFNPQAEIVANLECYPRTSLI